MGAPGGADLRGGSGARPRATHRAIPALVCALPLALGPACASAPGGRSSTRLTADDLQVITSEMAARLRASEFLSARTPDSPPITVAIQRVTNLSSDVIPVSEQWYLMERVRNALPITQLGTERNLVFVLPAERLRELRDLGFETGVGSERHPTHVMDAVFRSITRSAANNRTDLYMCEYRITDLGTGELAWADSFEFKRAALGRSWD